MINKNCEGRVPQAGEFTPEDQALLEQAYDAVKVSRAFIDDQLIHKYLEQLWQVVGEADRYIDANAPWALKKTDRDRMDTVLYVMAEVVRVLAILTQPVMPDSAGKLLDYLAVGEKDRCFDRLKMRYALVAGAELPKPSGVFPRYVEPETDA